ncbi:hypothetical protein GFH48_18630 [Streptomyces fagopyri]|uniref:Uncharacterized protein n=1 Tax=Streptomyces fagopyri TaxID=2662397 RepID=A0A5Q0LNB9_9ACTN|nr:hypothetical protein GFH48_18630 [Streptomyces fagopyri]
MVAQLAGDPPVVPSGRRRNGFTVLTGPVGVEEVLLGDAHDGSPLGTDRVRTGIRGPRAVRPGSVPSLRPCPAYVVPIDGRRQSAAALSVAGCTMRS